MFLDFSNFRINNLVPNQKYLTYPSEKCDYSYPL